MRRLAAGMALALALAAPAAAKPPVWIVRDRDSEMVLFGSVHLLPQGLDWRPAALDRVLAQADDVWFEVTAADGQAYSRQAWAKGTLPAGQSLFRLLAPDDAARLGRLAEAHHIDKQMLDRLKPWMASAVIGGAAMRTAGLSDQAGVEAVIAAAARPGSQQRGLDTPAQLVAANDDAPLKEQLADLARTLREIESGKNTQIVRSAVKAWGEGDLKTLARLATESMVTEPVSYRLLVTDRNARWATTLDARLKGRGRTVVVAGVGHMFGPGNLPDRLRALGYSVTGP